jgi:2,6-dihydroxypseudooxynicotine hydrolase
VSLGGYYAPRAAAFEKRVQACIALSGPFDWAGIYDRVPPLTRDTFRVRSKSRDDAEARARAATLTLAEAAPRITCPLFVMAGKQDRLVPWQEAERLAGAARGPVERCFIEDGNHVANNRVYRYRSQSADWMARHLQERAG